MGLIDLADFFFDRLDSFTTGGFLGNLLEIDPGGLDVVAGIGARIILLSLLFLDQLIERCFHCSAVGQIHFLQMFHFYPPQGANGVAQGVVLLAQRGDLLRLYGLRCLGIDREVNSFFELGGGVLTDFGLIDLKGVVSFLEMRDLQNLLIESLIERNPGEGIFGLRNARERESQFPIRESEALWIGVQGRGFTICLGEDLGGFCVQRETPNILRSSGLVEKEIGHDKMAGRTRMYAVLARQGELGIGFLTFPVEFIHRVPEIDRGHVFRTGKLQNKIGALPQSSVDSPQTLHG